MSSSPFFDGLASTGRVSLLDVNFCLFGEFRYQLLVLVPELLLGAVLACGNSYPTVTGEKVSGQEILVGIILLAIVTDDLLHLIAVLIYLGVSAQKDANNTVSERQ